MKKILLSLLSTVILLGASSQAFSAFIYVRHHNTSGGELRLVSNFLRCDGGYCFIPSVIYKYDTSQVSNQPSSIKDEGAFALQYVMQSSSSNCGLFVAAYKFKWETKYWYDYTPIGSNNSSCKISPTSILPEWGQFSYEIEQG